MCIYVCVYVFMCVCARVCVYISVYVYICLCIVCVCVYVYLCVCAYAYRCVQRSEVGVGFLGAARCGCRELDLGAVQEQFSHLTTSYGPWLPHLVFQSRSPWDLGLDQQAKGLQAPFPQC